MNRNDVVDIAFGVVVLSLLIVVLLVGAGLL